MGHKPQTRPFDQTDWTEVNDSVPLYHKSEILTRIAYIITHIA